MAQAQTTLPSGYWTEAQSAEILAKTEVIRLDPSLDALTAAERSALPDLLEVGALMQKLYELSRHAEAPAALSQLMSLHERLGKPVATQNLLELYRLNQGPIAVTLDNRREPFLPVAPQVPGRNVYPRDASSEQIDKFLAGQPSRRSEILGERSVVRRATRANIDADLATLKRFALIRELHPGWSERLQDLAKRPSPDAFYAVPYAIAYPEEMTRAFAALMRAADKIEPSDAEFSRYLRNRARDLVSNDYEAGDASWVTGRFARLNAQIGSYETYDDALYGVKAFHGMSILLRDEAATEQLRKALGGLQAIEDSLPYEPHKRVRDDIPVGVYDVIADFGQARGTNTASILPNRPPYRSAIPGCSCASPSPSISARCSARGAGRTSGSTRERGSASGSSAVPCTSTWRAATITSSAAPSTRQAVRAGPPASTCPSCSASVSEGAGPGAA
jgi:hypothetical protein